MSSTADKVIPGAWYATGPFIAKGNPYEGQYDE